MTNLILWCGAVLALSWPVWCQASSFWRRREALRQDILARSLDGRRRVVPEATGILQPDGTVIGRHGQWIDGDYYSPETLKAYGHPAYQDGHEPGEEFVITRHPR